jgi:hypothetical protein
MFTLTHPEYLDWNWMETSTPKSKNSERTVTALFMYPQHFRHFCLKSSQQCSKGGINDPTRKKTQSSWLTVSPVRTQGNRLRKHWQVGKTALSPLSYTQHTALLHSLHITCNKFTTHLSLSSEHWHAKV